MRKELEKKFFDMADLCETVISEKPEQALKCVRIMVDIYNSINQPSVEMLLSN